MRERGQSRVAGWHVPGWAMARRSAPDGRRRARRRRARRRRARKRPGRCVIVCLDICVEPVAPANHRISVCETAETPRYFCASAGTSLLLLRPSRAPPGPRAPLAPVLRWYLAGHYGEVDLGRLSSRLGFASAATSACLGLLLPGTPPAGRCSHGIGRRCGVRHALGRPTHAGRRDPAPRDRACALHRRPFHQRGRLR